MNIGFGFLIEGTVALLLMITIVTCMVLNVRLKRLKADEKAFKATIAELMSATEAAERAIAGLRQTILECDQDLGERLHNAERLSAEIIRQIAAGEAVLDRLTRVVVAARPLDEAPPESVSEAHAMVIAAEAFADRTQGRLTKRAA